MCVCIGVMKEACQHQTELMMAWYVVRCYIACDIMMLMWQGNGRYTMYILC